MEVASQPLYRGTYTDCEITFLRKVETPVVCTCLRPQTCGFAQQTLVQPERFLWRGPSYGLQRDGYVKFIFFSRRIGPPTPVTR